MGYETVMVNCNPETVSTDYSTSDRLYFEPLTPEDVAEVIAAEQAACVDGARVLGVIVALGGQTPLKLSHSIDPTLVLGTPVASIDAAEDREQWSAICQRSGLRQPPGDVALTSKEARDRQEDRLPGAGATELRARRTGDGDRLRRRGRSSG
jgi:carbamoyl-phosphate synthase large subunit